MQILPEFVQRSGRKAGCPRAQVHRNMWHPPENVSNALETIDELRTIALSLSSVITRIREHAPPRRPDSRKRFLAGVLSLLHETGCSTAAIPSFSARSRAFIATADRRV